MQYQWNDFQETKPSENEQVLYLHIQTNELYLGTYHGPQNEKDAHFRGVRLDGDCGYNEIACRGNLFGWAKLQLPETVPNSWNLLKSDGPLKHVSGNLLYSEQNFMVKRHDEQKDIGITSDGKQHKINLEQREHWWCSPERPSVNQFWSSSMIWRHMSGNAPI
ncbi:hypothetical protein M9194_13580 [Vibrio sp. S4M6]|uniref:hypothetical protein n=1 Tax=Vibrio sinus TaxID=2946865 RepID=UPI00202A6E40|nr:hypothetical protein [Vibrio sinus]MCL9782460.1 hypothetical protein [Vibrio sinus]